MISFYRQIKETLPIELPKLTFFIDELDCILLPPLALNWMSFPAPSLISKEETTLSPSLINNYYHPHIMS